MLKSIAISVALETGPNSSGSGPAPMTAYVVPLLKILRPKRTKYAGGGVQPFYFASPPPAITPPVLMLQPQKPRIKKFAPLAPLPFPFPLPGPPAPAVGNNAGNIGEPTQLYFEWYNSLGIPDATTTGSTLVVAILYETVATITPASGYSLIATQAIDGTYSIALYYYPSAPSQTNENFGLTGGQGFVNGIEILNASSSPFDQVSTTNGTGVIAACGATGTLSISPEFAVAYAAIDGAGNPATADSGYMPTYYYQASSGLYRGALFFSALSSPAATSTNITFLAGANWAGILATFE